MTTNAQIALSVVMLGRAIWALGFLLPKARREHGRSAIICSLPTALAGLIGWLLLGIRTH
jgi:hypothetical protein